MTCRTRPSSSATRTPTSAYGTRSMRAAMTSQSSTDSWGIKSKTWRTACTGLAMLRTARRCSFASAIESATPSRSAMNVALRRSSSLRGPRRRQLDQRVPIERDPLLDTGRRVVGQPVVVTGRHRGSSPESDRAHTTARCSRRPLRTPCRAQPSSPPAVDATVAASQVVPRHACPGEHGPRRAGQTQRRRFPADRNTMLERLGRFAARHHWWFIGGWVLLAVILVTYSGALKADTSDNFTIPGTESQTAFDLLQQDFPEVSGTAGTLVFQAQSGAITDPANAAVVNQVVQNVSGVPGVQPVVPSELNVPPIQFAQAANRVSTTDPSIAYFGLQFTDSAGDLARTTHRSPQRVGQPADRDRAGPSRERERGHRWTGRRHLQRAELAPVRTRGRHRSGAGRGGPVDRARRRRGDVRADRRGALRCRHRRVAHDRARAPLPDRIRRPGRRHDARLGCRHRLLPVHPQSLPTGAARRSRSRARGGTSHGDVGVRGAVRGHHGVPGDGGTGAHGCALRAHARARRAPCT